MSVCLSVFVCWFVCCRYNRDDDDDDDNDDDACLTVSSRSQPIC